MKPILYVRHVNEEENKQLEVGLRSQDAFVLRRCQIILSSSRKLSVSTIAEQVGCHRDTVRRVINEFNTKGLAILQKGSSRPHRIERAFDPEKAEKMKDLIHRSPREFGKASSLWSLELLAKVSFEEGLTKKEVSTETIRQTLQRLGIRWKRAKHWLTSTDPHYEMKKNVEIDG